MARLTQKHSYVEFTRKRDEFLEQLLLKARAQVGDELRRLMIQVKYEVTMRYPLIGEFIISPYSTNQLKQLDAALDRHMHSSALSMSAIWTKLRAQTFQFTWAASQKAVLNQDVGTDPKRLPSDTAETQAYDPTSLGPNIDRCYLALSRIRRSIMDGVEMSRILGESLPVAVERSMNAFPKPQLVKQARVIGRSIKEADTKPPVDPEDPYITGPEFIGKDEWEEILDEHKADYLPKYRDPRYELSTPKYNDDGTTVYPWQVENEMMDDFVYKVRAGEHEGANAQGIRDFGWVAILDSHTDECCEKRNGLTSAEIEEKLEGEWKDDECRAVTCPAHYGCRCSMSPVLDNLPDAPASNAQDFEEWLNS